MTNQVDWGIVNMERRLEDGAVYVLHWTASLTQEDAYAHSYGSISLADPDPSNFVPFSQLTKEQVIAWLFEALGPDGIIPIQENLSKQIQKQLNPEDAFGLPW